MGTPTTDRGAIRQIIRALRNHGYTLDAVNNGEEIIQVTNEREAVEEIMAVDEAVLFVDHPSKHSSLVCFVLGNEPYEVAADYGESLEPVIGPLTDSWDA